MDITTVDRFFIQQKLTLIGNEYRISTLGTGGDRPGEPVAYVRQKKMKIREEINFFADDSQQEVVLKLKARKVFEFRGRSEVQTPDGAVIGQLQKAFGKSFLRSSWEVLDASGTTVATAQERSLPLAIVRRVWGMVPYVSSIPFLVPFHFDIHSEGRLIGTLNRPVGLADRYLLDLSEDRTRRLDRRVAIAFAIALDALQDR